MSSFMKDVVSEVLQRNRTAAPGIAAPAPSCTVSSRENCPHTCAQPGHCSKPELPLQRTNYQKEQTARRLAVLAGLPSPAQAPAGRQPDSLAAARVMQPAKQPTADAVPGRDMAGQYLSPLLLRTLSPLEQKDNSPLGNSTQPRITPEPQDILAPVRLPAAGGLEVWLFPRIRDDLRPLLGSSSRNYSSAGVISAAACHPGQLFAAEELLSGEPELESDICWSNDGGGFELKLFGKDQHKVAAKLEELTAYMQAGAASPVRIWISLQPARLLRRYFGGGQQEAIAVVAGTSRWNSIGIAEQWLQRHPSSGLHLRTEHGYSIISGAAEQMAAAAPGLANLAETCR
ncbi:hypothetical protein [Paenibacillus tianjinensis]|uniref:Uncharacterized protein n=1 Tax=Paenibacillus tianjinensis TaxID=2810347 RepID=A0ABX7LCB8_9BACL|nr:hypothetical protein [Paenibacillus tianjinensis]QSF44429.1 hypothetical protein JRJ22_25005 [Paenibacillus tianjinensis]